MKYYQRHLCLVLTTIAALTMLTACAAYEDNPYPQDAAPKVWISSQAVSQTMAE